MVSCLFEWYCSYSMARQINVGEKPKMMQVYSIYNFGEITTRMVLTNPHRVNKGFEPRNKQPGIAKGSNSAQGIRQHGHPCTRVSGSRDGVSVGCCDRYTHQPGIDGRLKAVCYMTLLSVTTLSIHNHFLPGVMQGYNIHI